MDTKEKGRVLSIQSHVVYGYVGGKAAVFPLQTLGFEVDVVNTVNFSNHSGYGRFGGSRATAQDLTTIFETMEANKLLSQDRLLTGYIPGAAALSAIADQVKRMKSRKPSLIYLLDPVLGDSGRLYVAPDVIPIYKELLPEATIITPNWFEIETLTDTKLADFSSLKKALRKLHREFRVPNVVMSSMPFHGFMKEALPAGLRPKSTSDSPADESTHLICIASSTDTSGLENGEHVSTVHVHVIPSVPGYFSGVGDLFSALVLAHFKIESNSSHETSAQSTPLSIATSAALSKTLALLRFTHSICTARVAEEEDANATDEERDSQDPERRVRRMRRRELRLVQGQHLLRMSPTVRSNEHFDESSSVELRPMQQWENFWSTS